MNAVFGGMIELQVLNYIFQKNSFSIIILNGITEEHFNVYKDQFVFIRDFFNKYNQLPSKEVFQAKFVDNFEWITVTDPEEYLIQKLEEDKLYRDLIVEYKNLGNLIKDEKTDVAVEKMAELSQKFLKSKHTKCIDLIADVGERYESYLERVNNPTSSFVPTGLRELDEITGGWDMKNETAVICARTGIGKSWFTVYFAMIAAKNGLRVGYYSGEMEPDLIGYRFDTFMSNVPNGSLTHGNANVQESYKRYVDNLNKKVNGHIYCITPDMFDGNVTVTKLRAFIEKYDLQMLCVDQISLLNDERKARNPIEQFANLSRDLRTLQRLKKIPILIASQLNREESEDGPTTRNIGGSDRIGQDATTCLFFERKNDSIVITVGKARNSKAGDKLTYSWDINRGILNFIPTEKDATGGKYTEDVLVGYNDSGKSDSVF